MKSVIEAQGLTKWFVERRPVGAICRGVPPRTHVAVDRVTLAVGVGEVFGLLGPNGAGKTTFIKMLCTLLLPTAGSAVVCGYDVVREGRQVRAAIGLVASDERSFYWRLTGRQNLRFFAALHELFGKRAERRVEELSELMDLHDVLDSRFAEYSAGLRQRLAIVRGLLKGPQLLFMDEPTKGLDPLGAQTLLRIIKNRVAAAFGKTILITTHILREAEEVCDRVAIMNHGEIAVCGTTEDIRRTVTKGRRYLLHICGLAEVSVSESAAASGTAGRLHGATEDGGVSLELCLNEQTNTLPAVIREIVHRGGQIVRCTELGGSLEEVFRHVVTNGARARELETARGGAQEPGQ